MVLSIIQLNLDAELRGLNLPLHHLVSLEIRRKRKNKVHYRRKHTLGEINQN